MTKLFLIHLLSVLLFISTQAHSQCTEVNVHPDYAAMMSLYESTNGMFWHNNEVGDKGQLANLVIHAITMVVHGMVSVVRIAV